MLNGKKMKSLRESLRLSQQDAADLAGFTNYQQWAALEAGRKKHPRADTLAAIARALKCSMEVLLK